MKTFTLLVILTTLTLILLSFPEESHGVVFVLTEGRVRYIQKKGHERKKKRRKARLRNKNRRKRKRQENKRRIKEMKRWLKLFSKKSKIFDVGDRGVKKKPIWWSTNYAAGKAWKTRVLLLRTFSSKDTTLDCNILPASKEQKTKIQQRDWCEISLKIMF